MIQKVIQQSLFLPENKKVLLVKNEVKDYWVCIDSYDFNDYEELEWFERRVEDCYITTLKEAKEIYNQTKRRLSIDQFPESWSCNCMHRRHSNAEDCVTEKLTDKLQSKH